MRSPSIIRAELAETRARVTALECELQDTRQAEIDSVIAKFDQGMSRAEIARDMRMPKSAVGGILWRHGRTDAGRRRLHEVVRRHCSHSAQVSA